MGKPYSCVQLIMSRIFNYESHENLYQILQVTHAASEHAMKLKDSYVELSP